MHDQRKLNLPIFKHKIEACKGLLTRPRLSDFLPISPSGRVDKINWTILGWHRELQNSWCKANMHISGQGKQKIPISSYPITIYSLYLPFKTNFEWTQQKIFSIQRSYGQPLYTKRKLQKYQKTGWQKLWCYLSRR